MAISPFVARLRQRIGHDLLVLPSVSVLPRDNQGRILFVQLADSGRWATIGGAVEPDESPQDAAIRETQEEAGVTVRLDGLLTVLGGPEFRVTYPNGDVTSYVVTVFDATVTAGVPTPDGDETVAVEWWRPDALPYSEMGTLTLALLRAVGLGQPTS